MGCCSSHASRDKEYLRVILFGLENSGKTSLVHCLKTSTQIDQTLPSISTHGVIGMNVYLNIQTNVNLIIFDCGGCKHQRHIWPHFLNHSDVIVFTIDSHDETCLNDARQALFDLLTDESLIDKPLLIVLTKSDRKIRKTTRQLDQTLQLHSIEVSIELSRHECQLNFVLGSIYSSSSVLVGNIGWFDNDISMVCLF